MDAPLYPAAALGYRAWVVGENNSLLPFRSRVDAWMPGTNYAKCASYSHQAPDPLCHCGFNAYHQLDDAYLNAERFLEIFHARTHPPELVFGAIAGKGAIEIHHHGFRSQEALIVALFGRGQVLTKLAKAYRVPLLSGPSLLKRQLTALPGLQTIDPDLRPPAPREIRVTANPV